MLFNDYRNVKTVVFSELPKNEKMKYFNFLLENEINFTRDENGYYVALVKVLNPAFYGEQSNNPNASLSSTMQGGKFESPFENPMESNKKEARSTSQTMNQTRTKTKDANSTLRSKSPLTGKKTTNNNFEKPKDNFKTSVQTYGELFNDKYSRFFKSLNPIVGVRGKKMNLYQLKYNIEEIYSIRFIKDTSSLRNQLTKSGKNQEIDVKDPFPIFVVEFLTNKFVKKPMIDQHALDLLLSLDYYKKNHRDVEIFAKFLNEEYDADDLIFFLFVRSCIEKEMKMMFIEKSREEIKIQYHEDREEIDTELYLNIKVCLKIANTIFGNEEELLLNSFMEKIEKNLISNQKKGKKLIKASSILEITLEDYHQSRKLYGQGNSNMNLEKLKQTDVNRNNNSNQDRYRDENLFDEFEEESNEINNTNKRISFSKLGNNNTKNVNDKQSNTTSGKTNNQIIKQDLPEPKNINEKITRLKTIIFNFIKERELDIFFEKLMTSYSIYEKESDIIESNLVTIKELVSKKLALLISIIFNKDQQNWFISLKIKEEDSQSLKHYGTLINLMNQMMSNNLSQIPENLIENFGQTLLSTPELNAQINKLILKHFG